MKPEESTEPAVRHEVLEQLRSEFQDHGDLAELERIFLLYVNNARRNLRAAQDALARTDMPALELAAHSLKGSSSSIGAARLSALSATLEAFACGGPSIEPASLLRDLERELTRVEKELQGTT